MDLVCEMREGKISDSSSDKGNGVEDRTIQPGKPFLRTMTLTLMEIELPKGSKQKCGITGHFFTRAASCCID